jgi:hypothetical protein
MECTESEFVRPIKAFRMLDISKSRGYEALQRGEIPFIRIANQIRIPRTWIEQKVKEALTTGADTGRA